MPAQQRRMVQAERRTRAALLALGEEVRNARLAAGLSQAAVAGVAGLSQPTLSRLERAGAARLTIRDAMRAGAAVGLDISVRAFPNGPPVRDAGHVRLLERLRARLPPPLRLRTELPVAAGGDARAFDGLITGVRPVAGVEAEMRLVDVQAVERRIALKKRVSRVPRVILLVPDTRHNRLVLRAARDALAARFPLGTRAILNSLASGRAPSDDGIIVL